MNVSTRKIAYTRDYTEVYEYENGLAIWKDIDYYYDTEVREKVIMRIDVMPYLTDIFSIGTITKYRSLIWNLAAKRNLNVNQISAALIEMVKTDSTFEVKLNEFYYTCDMGVSFGDYILSSIADAILAVEDRYRSFFRGINQKVICSSFGYLYIAVPDDYVKILLPEKVNYEVISYAKNGSCDVTFAE